MTTTLPFTLNALGRVATVGSELVYIDASLNAKTWKSTDAILWTPHAWTGNYVTDSIFEIPFFNGYFWYWIADWESGLIYTFRSSDGVSWANLGTRNYPYGDTFYSASVIVHNGFVVCISTTKYLRTTSNGQDWSEPLLSNLPGSIRKLVSYGPSIYAIPIGGVANKTVYRSDNSGLTWTAITTNWGLDASYTVDCIVTTDGLLVVQENNETWTSLDGITWSRKTYTKPANSMANGKICALGMDLFIVGCGASRNTVFKLIVSSAPVAIPL